MSTAPEPPAATATIAVRVDVAPEIAFQVFTLEIDRWWRRGPKYRHAGTAPGSIAIEPRLGGRVYERWRDDAGEHDFELGRVELWQPPRQLRFSWRNATFAEPERTEVEVTFAPSGSGTLVTVRHRGWEQLRQDHPARHGHADAALARSVGMWWSEQLTAMRLFASSRPLPGPA